MTFSFKCKTKAAAIISCLLAVSILSQPVSAKALSYEDAVYPSAFDINGELQSSSISNGQFSALSTSTADQVIQIGNQYLGTPYKFGADSNQTRNFDCSSFVQYVYSQVGVDLPRTSYSQATEGTAVKRSELQKGDLVFFSSGRRGKGKVSHVAIYAGNDKLLHTYGKPGVTYSNLSDSTWDNQYVTARRVL
ncbi:C40 family peptidase [Paenibacillus marinisediminis]